MRDLRISKELALPLDFVTKTVGLLAQRRKGKTYTASVIAEELVAAEVPFVKLGLVEQRSRRITDEFMGAVS